MPSGAFRFVEERIALAELGVGVFSLSTDWALSFSRPRIGVEGRPDLSDDFDKELIELMESRLGGPSSRNPRSLILEGCNVCVRLCGLGLVTKARSEMLSVFLLVRGGMTAAASRAFSLRAACAD